MPMLFQRYLIVMKLLALGAAIAVVLLLDIALPELELLADERIVLVVIMIALVVGVTIAAAVNVYEGMKKQPGH
ncbi:MAG: hypothetical protein HYY37_00935 [Candidatus Aenigmarchaeota archaeon]|nr:hypothetical protein [Candidatus Aenigmarchaeota archaeon]